MITHLYNYVIITIPHNNAKQTKTTKPTPLITPHNHTQFIYKYKNRVNKQTIEKCTHS